MFSFNPGFNLLIGENGAGKTTLLRSIRATLGTLNGRTPIVDDDDIRLLANELHIEAEVVAPKPNNLYVSRLDKKLRKKVKRNSFTDTFDSRLPPLVLHYSSTEASCSSFAHRKTRRFYLGRTSKITEKEEELYEAERRRILNPNVTERFGSSKSVRDFVIRILSQFSETFRDFSWSFEPYDCRIRQPYTNKLPSIRRELIGAIMGYIQVEQSRQLRLIDQTHIIINSQGHIIGESKTTPMIPPFRELLKSAVMDRDTASKLEDCTVEIRLAPRIQIRSQSKTLFLNQLSDGEQRLFSLFVDIARQLDLQGMERNIDTNFAIILIDEIDVHLHPKWQQMVVPLLKDLFPACQFIATTHSPFVIQSLQPGELVVLKHLEFEDEVNSAAVDGEGSIMSNHQAPPPPPINYSDNSIENISEQLMGIKMPQKSKRYLDMVRAAEEYYELLDRTKKAPADEKESLKGRLDEKLIPFERDPAFVAFLKFQREAKLRENAPG